MTNYAISRTEEFSDNSELENSGIRKEWLITLHLEQGSLNDNSEWIA